MQRYHNCFENYMGDHNTDCYLLASVQRRAGNNQGLQRIRTSSSVNKRDRVMLSVIEYFAKSLKVTKGILK